MLKENPNERICLADVIGHPWLTGAHIASEEEVRVNFLAREAMIKQNMNA